MTWGSSFWTTSMLAARCWTIDDPFPSMSCSLSTHRGQVIPSGTTIGCIEVHPFLGYDFHGLIPWGPSLLSICSWNFNSWINMLHTFWGIYSYSMIYIYIFKYVALDWYKQLPWTLETLAVICPWGKNCIPSGWSNVACWKTSPCSIDLKGRYNTSWVLPKHVIKVPWQNDND